MPQAIRYSEYLRNVSLVEHQISYNLLTPEVGFDTNGKIIPYVAPPVTLNNLHISRLIKTHVQGRFMEQFRVVIPLAAYLIMFLVFILNQEVSAPWSMAFGLLGVITGLMFFMEGLKLGLMPFGNLLAPRCRANYHFLPLLSPCVGCRGDLCRAGNRCAEGGRSECFC